jgi:NOL1/NOP2/sun family putative RNA methylase
MNLDEKYLERMKKLLKEDYDLYIESLSKETKGSFYINENYSINPVLSFDTEKIEHFDNAYYHNVFKIGNTIEYLSGSFYPQEAFAMLPILAYDIKDDIKVLDMCAAPGGKTILLSNKVKNGIVVSNEIDYKRNKILYSNIERLGLKNVLITNNDTNTLKNTFSNYFDLILLDAPCSGEGMFKKEEESVSQWSENLVISCQKRDIELINNAHNMLKTNGILIYSTCTFSQEENEDIINYLLENYNYEVIKPKEFVFDITKPGINLEYARRCYPYLSNGHGQFFCALKKLEENNETYKTSKNKVNLKNKIVDQFIKENLIEEIPYFEYKNKIYSIKEPINVDTSKLNITSYGVLLGEVVKNYFSPNHYFFKAYYDLFKNKVNLDINNPLIKNYLKGEEINQECNNGYGVLLVNNIPLGGFKAVNNRLKNYYPKGLRKIL